MDNAVINKEDLEEIYAFANERANGKRYCVMFESEKHYELTEDGLEYLLENPHKENIIAKVYVLNNAESERKTRLHLLFDKPEIKPNLFHNADQGKSWLKSKLQREFL